MIWGTANVVIIAVAYDQNTVQVIVASRNLAVGISMGNIKDLRLS